MTQARLVVKGLRGREALELLVDTRSLYTWVSESVLKRLEVSATSRRRVTTTEGRVLERPIGEVPVEMTGRVLTASWSSPNRSMLT